jgi:hypothetical protein
VRVYAVIGQYHTYNDEHDWYTEYEELLEIFAREQDAKKFIAGHDKKRYEGATEPDELGNWYDDFAIEPRPLRTAWNG